MSDSTTSKFASLLVIQTPPPRPSSRLHLILLRIRSTISPYIATIRPIWPQIPHTSHPVCPYGPRTNSHTTYIHTAPIPFHPPSTILSLRLPVLHYVFALHLDKRPSHDLNCFHAPVSTINVAESCKSRKRSPTAYATYNCDKVFLARYAHSIIAAIPVIIQHLSGCATTPSSRRDFRSTRLSRCPKLPTGVASSAPSSLRRRAFNFRRSRGWQDGHLALQPQE